MEKIKEGFLGKGASASVTVGSRQSEHGACLATLEGPSGGCAEDVGILGSRGAPQTPAGYLDVWAHCSALGSGLRAAASSGFLMAGPAAPPPHYCRQSGSAGESPPLAKMAEGEVLTLGRPKARKVNG